MLGLNAIALVFFGCINVLAYQLCKCPPALVLNVALVAVRAALLRPYVAGSEELLIYILLDGAAVRQLLPESAWSVALPIYYAAAASFVLLTVRGFFRTNRRQYQKFSALQAA